jgi:hypothetical protein
VESEILFAKEHGRKWSADFGIPKAKILFEIEGGLYGGRHTSPTGYIEDCDKYNQAQMLGYKVFRFSYIPHSPFNQLDYRYISYFYRYANYLLNLQSKTQTEGQKTSS